LAIFTVRLTNENVSLQNLTPVYSVTAFAIGQLDRAITAYLRHYPNVEVELMTSERMVDLVDEGFDLAVRIAKQLSPGLIGRRLAPVRIVVCASLDYLKTHGAPSSPEELVHHNCLFYS